MSERSSNGKADLAGCDSDRGIGEDAEAGRPQPRARELPRRDSSSIALVTLQGS